MYEGIREAQVFNCPPLWVLVRRSLLSCHFYIWCWTWSLGGWHHKERWEWSGGEQGWARVCLLLPPGLQLAGCRQPVGGAGLGYIEVEGNGCPAAALQAATASDALQWPWSMRSTVAAALHLLHGSLLLVTSVHVKPCRARNSKKRSPSLAQLMQREWMQQGLKMYKYSHKQYKQFYLCFNLTIKWTYMEYLFPWMLLLQWNKQKAGGKKPQCGLRLLWGIWSNNFRTDYILIFC